jgi:hypothetical protein
MLKEIKKLSKELTFCRPVSDRTLIGRGPQMRSGRAGPQHQRCREGIRGWADEEEDGLTPLLFVY